MSCKCNPMSNFPSMSMATTQVGARATAPPLTRPPSPIITQKTTKLRGDKRERGELALILFLSKSCMKQRMIKRGDIYLGGGQHRRSSDDGWRQCMWTDDNHYQKKKKSLFGHNNLVSLSILIFLFAPSIEHSYGRTLVIQIEYLF